MFCSPIVYSEYPTLLLALTTLLPLYSTSSYTSLNLWAYFTTYLNRNAWSQVSCNCGEVSGYKNMIPNLCIKKVILQVFGDKKSFSFMLSIQHYTVCSVQVGKGSNVERSMEQICVYQLCISLICVQYKTYEYVFQISTTLWPIESKHLCKNKYNFSNSFNVHGFV